MASNAQEPGSGIAVRRKAKSRPRIGLQAPQCGPPSGQVLLPVDTTALQCTSPTVGPAPAKAQSQPGSAFATLNQYSWPNGSGDRSVGPMKVSWMSAKK